MQLASRLGKVRPSPILALVQKARHLRQHGHDIIDLGIGEPDFDTPVNIKDAAFAAIRRGETKYTLVNGTPALRTAIVEKLGRENGLDYDINQILVTGGAKQAIYNVMMATLDEGDEVIIPAPYWSSYPDVVAISAGAPVFVECPQSQGFRITPQQLNAAITTRTKWLIINSPCNPTGGAYSASELTALGDVLKQHPHVGVLSDDIYEHLFFDDRKFESIVALCPHLYDRTVLINGVSKAYAMTGWRLGYSAGPQDLTAAMAKVQSQSTTHACSISQAAAIEAMTGPQNLVADRLAIYQERRDIVVNALEAIDGIDCHKPEGAFYVYPSCAGLLGKTTPDGQVIAGDVDFCIYLLEKHGVSCVPGNAFGLSPYLRISTAASNEALAEAMKRITTAVKELS
jgi:aspartate aminotransferase